MASKQPEVTEPAGYTGGTQPWNPKQEPRANSPIPTLPYYTNSREQVISLEFFRTMSYEAVCKTVGIKPSALEA
jgi:hypothetical protein